MVKPEGSREAQQLTDEMTEACDSEWRGLGVIPKSGVQLKEAWSTFDARKKYAIPPIQEKPIRHADVVMSCRENVSHPTVKCLERDVPRSIQ